MAINVNQVDCKFSDRGTKSANGFMNPDFVQGLWWMNWWALSVLPVLLPWLLCETFKVCGEEGGAMICHLQAEKRKYRQNCHRRNLTLNMRNTFWMSALGSTGTAVWVPPPGIRPSVVLGLVSGLSRSQTRPHHGACQELLQGSILLAKRLTFFTFLLPSFPINLMARAVFAALNFWRLRTCKRKEDLPSCKQN